MKWTAHRTALAGIVVFGAVLFVIPIVQGEVFIFRDHLIYFLPLRFHTAAVLRGGHLPLWNPYNATGEPWLANPQTGVFYPPTWMFLAFPFPTAYMLFLMFHVVLAGWAAYLLFSRTASSGASLVGAVGLMFSGPTLSLLDTSNNLTTFAWIPLILWLAIERAHGPRSLPLSIDALALAMAFLAGEPFFAALAAIAYSIILLTTRRSAESIRLIAVVGVIAFALCAVQLLPFLEWLRGTDRGFDFSGAKMVEGLTAAHWLRVALPPHSTSEGEPLLLSQFIAMPYAGFFVPAAAVLGLAVSVIRRRFALLAGWLVLIAISAILAAGSNLPTGWIFDALHVRYPARMMTIAMIGIAGLAVLGWDAIRPGRVWADCVIAIIIAVELVPRTMPLLHTISANELAIPLDPSIGRSQQIFRLPVGAPTMDDPHAWLYGYQNLYGRRFDTGSASPAVPIRYLQIFQAAWKGPRTDIMNLLSAGYVLCDRPLPLAPIARVRNVTVYRNDAALPMATFWTHTVGDTSKETAMKAVLAGNWREGLHVSGFDARARASPRSAIYGAGIARIDSSVAAVMFTAPEDGVLMIAQRDAPGWRVFVDGKEQPKLVAFGLFRAVALRAGQHHITWRFLPMMLPIGGVITAMGLVWLVIDVRRTRRRIG